MFTCRLEATISGASFPGWKKCCQLGASHMDKDMEAGTQGSGINAVHLFLDNRSSHGKETRRLNENSGKISCLGHRVWLLEGNEGMEHILGTTT